jgi:hypothetical protein
MFKPSRFWYRLTKEFFPVSNVSPNFNWQEDPYDSFCLLIMKLESRAQYVGRLGTRSHVEDSSTKVQTRLIQNTWLRSWNRPRLAWHGVTPGQVAWSAVVKLRRSTFYVLLFGAYFGMQVTTRRQMRRKAIPLLLIPNEITSLIFIECVHDITVTILLYLHVFHSTIHRLVVKLWLTDCWTKYM